MNVFSLPLGGVPFEQEGASHEPSPSDIFLFHIASASENFAQDAAWKMQARDIHAFLQHSHTSPKH
jgi:hypothetical protein